MTAKIYKICSMKGEKCYIGSTAKPYLSARKSDHLSKYRLGKGRHCASYELFEEYGVDDCEFVLLEECEEAQRYVRERWWMENTPQCVNLTRPIITEEEKKELKAESHQRIKASQTEEEKKKKADYRRQWNKENREVPIQCECGMMATIGHLTRHRTTVAHQKLMDNPFWSAFDSLIIVPKVVRIAVDKKEYMAKYHEAYKNSEKYKAKNDRLKEKVPCEECGSVMMRANLSRHKKTHHTK